MPSNKPDPSSGPAKQGLAARRAALDLMTAVTEEGRLLPELLAKVVADLSPSDRARAQRLATEALRWSGRSDHFLGPYLRRKPEDRILNVLRLAVFEMLGDKSQSHGVVDSAVTLSKRSNPKASGMVNAVLRNVMRGEPEWDKAPVPHLPKWLRKEILRDHGKPVTVQIEVAHAATPPLDLTPKSGQAEAIVAATGGTLLPSGSVRLAATGQVSALPGFEDGTWWVQDAAAAIPAQMLAVRPGEKVLDLCAAPGGKTMQLVDAGADVTALDNSAKRMERVTENLARTGLSAKIVIADALEWVPSMLFDAVLLDAPCSATGTIRRHPDLPHAKSTEIVGELVPLQALLLDRALSMLRPGGRLVYCTCSPSESRRRRSTGRRTGSPPQSCRPAPQPRLDRSGLGHRERRPSAQARFLVRTGRYGRLFRGLPAKARLRGEIDHDTACRVT